MGLRREKSVDYMHRAPVQPKNWSESSKVLGIRGHLILQTWAEGRQWVTSARLHPVGNGWVMMTANNARGRTQENIIGQRRRQRHRRSLDTHMNYLMHS